MRENRRGFIRAPNFFSEGDEEYLAGVVRKIPAVTSLERSHGSIAWKPHEYWLRRRRVSRGVQCGMPGGIT
jgi:hypothetical protein